MTAPYYLVIQGRFVVADKEPDGDSVRFVADNLDHYAELHRGHRTHISVDNSVQLRFEGVDAPEIHYGDYEQPLSRDARDQLLRWIGFDVEYGDPASPNKVTTSYPDAIPCTVLSQACDQNGRPIAYIIPGTDAIALEDGDWILAGHEVLERTLNFRLLAEGLAYCLLYTSTPLSHRRLFREVTQPVRRQGKGVWGEDVTREFTLDNQRSIGPGGQLIFPKLFRRCTDYLKDSRGGFRGSLHDWLLEHSTGRENKNDAAVVSDRLELHLSDLVEQTGNRITFRADQLDIAFVEK